MNALDLLLEQHRKVESLLAECKKASGKEKRSLFHAIADALVLHTAIEETHFYPGALGAAAEETLREALEEHLLIKRSLADLLSLEDELGPEFDAKLQVLEELFEHHIKEEEESLFPTVEKKLSKTKLEELGQAMQEMTTELEQEEDLYHRVQDVDELAQAPSLRRD